jgi:hypothetical protein
MVDNAELSWKQKLLVEVIEFGIKMDVNAEHSRKQSFQLK